MTETRFPDHTVLNYYNAIFEEVEQGNSVIITDDHVFEAHSDKMKGFRVIKIAAGEQNKIQSTADRIITELLDFEVDKKTTLCAIGGGVVTDITGLVASIYKRGVPLTLVPSTILAMVDAVIGGKNGINSNGYKNMIGTTRQPDKIIIDYRFLDTLPETEWQNGFAEIIKHACIRDADMFNMLESTSFSQFKEDRSIVAALIEKNIALKTEVVLNDEHESGERYILNFGHSFGHAIEVLYNLPHGHAVSIGMMMAARISEEINNFPSEQVMRLKKLLVDYGLPVEIKMEHETVLELMKKDKKRAGNEINFVLLDHIGKANIQKISFDQLQDLQNQLF